MFFYNESDSEVSIVQPVASDPYFYNTSLLLKMDSDFSDSSVHQHTVTLIGNSTISSTESKYGVASGYFDGSDTLLIPADSNFQFGTQDFTFECWIYGGQQADVITILDMRPQGQSGAYPTLYFTPTDNVLHFLAGNDGVIEATVSIFDSAWHHIAVSRNENSAKLFVDGLQVGSTIVDNNIYSSGANITIMGTSYHNPPLGNNFVGYIDDVRITKGVARYTANFTPPDSHPTTGPSEIVSTDLQLHLDAGDINSYPGTGTTWYDLSGNGNNGSFVGTPSFDSATNSIYFDSGTNTYIQTPYNSLVSNISLSIWVKAPVQDGDTGSGIRPILMLGDYSTQGPLAISIGSPGFSSVGKLIFVAGKDTDPYRHITAGRYDDDQWRNLILVKDTNNIRIYMNGEKIVDQAGDTDNVYDTSIALRVGGGTSHTARRFLGRIAEVLVYEKSLSDAEVLQNFNATKTRFGL